MIKKAWKINKKDIQRFGNYIKENFPEYSWDGHDINDIDGDDIYFLLQDNYGKFFTWTMEEEYNNYESKPNIEIFK